MTCIVYTYSLVTNQRLSYGATALVFLTSSPSSPSTSPLSLLTPFLRILSTIMKVSVSRLLMTPSFIVS